MSRHTGPMTDNYIQALRRRTELRLGHSRLQLGERWLLHPANSIRRSISLYCQQVGRIRRPLFIDFMAGFKVQEVPRELRL